MKRPHGSRSFAAAGALLVALASPAASAGEASAAFNVNITLNDPLAASQGVCISETLSAQTNAVVQVVCSSGQFVRIDPDPTRPFLGVHGGAFRYHFGTRYEIGPPDRLDGDELRYIGAGTVTAVRVYNPGSKTSLLELLVSF
jgi:hypothetical protein